jgi:SAM-dependent methyltransferase
MIDHHRDEFDMMATWTADVLDQLPLERSIPGACNGSNSPMALAWLAESLRLADADHLLDIGCGLGGALAWAHHRYEVRMTGIEPMESAARRGATLFGHEVIVGSATNLPLPPGVIDRAWMLGVLDTVDDQPRALLSTRAALADSGRLGLLAYVARRHIEAERIPEGNHFLTEAELIQLLVDSRFVMLDALSSDELLEAPVDWKAERAHITSSIATLHGDDERWVGANRKSRQIAQLLQDGSIAPLLISAACV